MRERLLAGEVLTNRGIQAEYGISNDHTVSDAAAKLRNDGYNVVKDQRVEKSPDGRTVSQAYWHVEPKKRVPRRNQSPSKRASSRRSPKNSISEQVRQRLLEGDALSAREVAEQYGVSRSLLGGVMAQMRQNGHVIDAKRVEGGEIEFRLEATAPTGPQPPPEPAPRAKLKSRRAIYADLALRFEAGERIDAHMVMKDYGVNSMRFLAGFIQAQRKKGWAFSRASRKTEDGWRTVYRLKRVDPKKAPAWADEQVTEEAEQIVDVTQGSLIPVEGLPAPLDVPPDLPPLATQVSVVLHLWDPETGVWTLGLRNGQTSWLIPVAHG